MSTTCRRMTSRPTLVRRAPRRTRPAEAGFTLVELAVTMMVMGIVATAVIAVAMRTFTTTATITNRRDVLADGRIALDRVSKQLRQGEWVDQTGSTASSITFSGYPDAVVPHGQQRLHVYEPRRGGRPGHRIAVARDRHIHHPAQHGRGSSQRANIRRPT
ncbi:MAG: type II secretion system protein [Actinobacteria bacterium]|nr:MAG: type II secretion system protein [Actinomycetota bacterium]